MTKETVTFRIDADKRAALDRLAEKRVRDRSYLLNEAVDAYLDVHTWLQRWFACARLSQPCLPGSSSRLFRNAHHHGF